MTLFTFTIFTLCSMLRKGICDWFCPSVCLSVIQKKILEKDFLIVYRSIKCIKKLKISSRRRLNNLHYFKRGLCIRSTEVSNLCRKLTIFLNIYTAPWTLLNITSRTNVIFTPASLLQSLLIKLLCL